MSSILKNKKTMFSVFLIFSSIFMMNAKSKKDKQVIKYVHPRIYEFDLCDTENQVFLSYNPNIKLFDVYIDFSKYVKEDLPQAGDKVIFYYKGYSTKDGGSVKATVTGDNNQRITDEEKYFSRVVNNDKNSPISVVNRGREVVYRETSPGVTGSVNQAYIDNYAAQLLRNLSCLEHKVTYTHGYCPVRVGDCVRLDYKKAGLDNVKAKVISQSIKCETGCPVEETAVYTTKLWR